MLNFLLPILVAISLNTVLTSIYMYIMYIVYNKRFRVNLDIATPYPLTQNSALPPRCFYYPHTQSRVAYTVRHPPRILPSIHIYQANLHIYQRRV